MGNNKEYSKKIRLSDGSVFARAPAQPEIRLSDGNVYRWNGEEYVVEQSYNSKYLGSTLNRINAERDQIEDGHKQIVRQREIKKASKKLFSKAGLFNDMGEEGVNYLNSLINRGFVPRQMDDQEQQELVSGHITNDKYVRDLGKKQVKRTEKKPILGIRIGSISDEITLPHDLKLEQEMKLRREGRIESGYTETRSENIVGKVFKGLFRRNKNS